MFKSNIVNTEAENVKTMIERTYETYREGLITYVYYKIDDLEQAEDLVQDAFLRLLNYDLKIDEKTVQSFLFTIVRNLLIDYLRHVYTKKEKLSYLSLVTDPFTSSGADCRLNVREVLTLHEKAKSRLTPRVRQVYEMKCERNLSIPEICRRLSISVNTAECHLFLARRDVRDYVRKALTAKGTFYSQMSYIGS